MQNTFDQIDELAVNTVRTLSIEAIQKANSGHPGMPMGMAEIAVALWAGHYKHNPANPKWVNRDRFLLSNGHGSMLHYSLLHLTGYDLSMDDIKAFRQMHSKTPGHPEVDITPGVETTTGPLGQGIANAVGFAMSARHSQELFDPSATPGESVFDHNVFCIAGDGCMQEGVSGEASSMAATLELGNLFLIYDDNRISIEGDTKIAFSEDVEARYTAYGWHVQHVDFTNGFTTYEEKVAELYDTIEKAKAVTEWPEGKLLLVNTSPIT